MKEIQLTQGKVAIVDDDDFQWLNQWKWHANNKEYAVRTPTINGKQIGVKMHREILGLIKGDGKLVDHINGNPLDNRRENLRVCSNDENQHNSITRKDNTSGFKGVGFHKARQRWNSRIWIDGNRKSLGYFDTPEAARDAYQQASLKYHGKFANFGSGCVILKDSNADS